MQLIIIYKTLRMATRYIIYPLLLTNLLFSTVKKRILENSSQKLILQINVNARTDADLFPTTHLIGLPSNLSLIHI